MKPKYKCERCNYVWEENEPGSTQCPKCAHLYVIWLNFEKMRRGSWAV